MFSHVIIDTLCFNIREERLHHRSGLYRLRRERETVEEREGRLARQREYMRHRRAVLMELRTKQPVVTHPFCFLVPFSFCARGPCFNSIQCALDTKWRIS